MTAMTAMTEADKQRLRRDLDSRQRETRAFVVKDLRVKRDDGGPTKIVGHPIVYNVLSEDLGWFRERILTGAAKNTIAVADIRALFNHDPNYVLGRNRSKTLDLSEDETGLYMEVTPPDTQWARDLMVSMERGDITQMSFGFYVVEARWVVENEEDIREVGELELFDVSVVTFPAYPQTDAQARSLTLNVDEAALSAAIARAIRETSAPAAPAPTTELQPEPSTPEGLEIEQLQDELALAAAT